MAGGFVFPGRGFFRLGPCHRVPWKGEGNGVTRRPTTTPAEKRRGEVGCQGTVLSAHFGSNSAKILLLPKVFSQKF